MIMKQRIAYYTFLVFMTIVYTISTLLLLHYFALNVLLSLIIFLATFLLFFFLVGILPSRYFFKKILLILDEDCDPVTYLEVYRKFYNIPSNTTNYLHIINQCAALISMGDFNSTSQLLTQLNQKKLQKSNYNHAVYLNNLAVMLLSTGDFEGAEALWEKIRQLPFKKGIPPQIDTMLQFNEVTTLIVTKHFVEAKTLLTSLSHLIESRRLKVNYYYNLGIIEGNLNNEDLAKEYLTLVATEGNTLAVASQAKQMLVDLSTEV